MKSLIISSLIFLSLSATACTQSHTVTDAVEQPKEPVTKKVCIKVWDAKRQAEVEKCRNLKVREKYEGTPIPSK